MRQLTCSTVCSTTVPSWSRRSRWTTAGSNCELSPDPNTAASGTMNWSPP
jgi:hypothetical protein